MLLTAWLETGYITYCVAWNGLHYLLRGLKRVILFTAWLETGYITYCVAWNGSYYLLRGLKRVILFTAWLETGNITYCVAWNGSYYLLRGLKRVILLAAWLETGHITYCVAWNGLYYLLRGLKRVILLTAWLETGYITYCIILLLCNLREHCGNQTAFFRNYVFHNTLRRGADKSLARPGRKQSTATKLGIHSTYSQRSSIHFLVLRRLALQEKTWWKLASPCCWNRKRGPTCFLSASVTTKVLQFGT